MKHFFAVHIADLESASFERATPEQVTNWLYLHAYCTKQFNGGAIADAKAASERFWAMRGVDASLLAQESPLWAWDGNALIIQPYDVEGEELARKKSEGGQLGAAKRWNAVREAKSGSDNRSPNGSPRCTNQPDQPNQTNQTTKQPTPDFSILETGRRHQEPESA